MADKLEHRQILGVVNSLSEAKIVDLDASIRTLVDPVANGLSKGGVGGEAALHILCCNEYFLVTGLTDRGNIAEVRQTLDAIRSSLGATRQG
jgi:hypothetical protein